MACASSSCSRIQVGFLSFAVHEKSGGVAVRCQDNALTDHGAVAHRVTPREGRRWRTLGYSRRLELTRGVNLARALFTQDAFSSASGIMQGCRSHGSVTGMKRKMLAAAHRGAPPVYIRCDSRNRAIPKSWPLPPSASLPVQARPAFAAGGPAIAGRPYGSGETQSRAPGSGARAARVL
jgi:hypothetical protein